MILVDTSFIIAYNIISDTQHDKTMKMKHHLVNNECCITNSILNECVTVSFNKSKSLEIANNVYYSLIDNFKVINEYGIEKFNSKTLSIFNKHNGKLSFIDASLIVVMHEVNIDYLLTFDKQFKKEDTIKLIE